MDVNEQQLKICRSVVEWLDRQNECYQSRTNRIRSRLDTLKETQVLDVSLLQPNGKGTRVIKRDQMTANTLTHPMYPNVVCIDSTSNGLEVFTDIINI